MRGGTSKGVFFHEKDLPADRKEWDAILLAAFGSPDPRQIDGLGGSHSVTSKAAIIGPGTQPGIDINYTFAQVSIEAPLVDYRSNCGNISSAVGPFAIDEGLIQAKEPVTCVRILNTNTNKVIEAEVLVNGGQAMVAGDCQIAGVPGSGAPIRMGFVEPGGSVTRKLLPTGQPIDHLNLPELGVIEVSLVDAANPAVFVRAADVGMTGLETADEINNQPDLLQKLELIRSAAAELLDFVNDRRQATAKSPSIPKMAVIAPPMFYQTVQGQIIKAEEIDVTARIMSMQRAHKAYALTGAIATAAAAIIPGTIVANASQDIVTRTGHLRLGHPAGTMNLDIEATQENDLVQIQKVVAERTARRLMDGYVYVTNERLQS
jgi:hypothetical protein